MVLFVPIFVVMAFCIVFGAGASDVCSAYDGAQANSVCRPLYAVLRHTHV